MNKTRKKYISVQGFPTVLKGHFAHRIYQKGHIEKIG
jgi:hypothetical protein